MSSYHSKFKYLNKDSMKDFGWVVVHFEADTGEFDSYLSQEQIYTDSYKRTRRLLYGTKWGEVATVKITVIKQNRSDFTERECREAYKWLTGNPIASYLDLYAGDSLRYSFLGTVQDVKPEKLDARTVGLHIYFESVSPWAYSPIKTVNCSFGQDLQTIENGILTKGTGDVALLDVTDDGVLYNGIDGGSGVFQITDNNVVYIDNSVHIHIDNQSDDLYSYVILNTVFTNVNSTYVSIYNKTLNEETIITNMSVNEEVTLNDNQFIVSDKPLKIFGDSFNYIWPRLAPGINEFVVSGTGAGYIKFTYRYPIKIGDCAIDIGNFDGECTCVENEQYRFIDWNDITNTPDTLAGYGITDAYTDREIDDKLAEIDVGEDISCDCDTTIDKNELNQMLINILR